MEYCSPLWAGVPASHLSRLHAVETKAFMIIGVSCDEAASLGLSLSHHRQVGGLSVFYRLLSGLAPCSVCDLSPPYFCRVLKVRQHPPSGKITEITNRCSPSLFHSSFFHTFGTTPSLSSIPFFPPGLQHSCSPPPLIIPLPNPRSFLPPLIHPKPTSFKFPAFLPESPCNVHLVYPHVRHPIPLPSTDLLMSLFLTLLSFQCRSCLMPPLLCVVC